ncbi:MAG: ABC transporter permease subunit [Lachnospiraceae bacterium]|nr:ABC transporter permease subunit [Lachnospiraceae bacterium]
MAKQNHSDAAVLETKGFAALLRDIKNNKVIYLLLLVILAFFIVFNYAPLVGLLMAFERYSPKKGFFGSTWVGLDNFKVFFTGPYIGRLIKNTVGMGVLDLVINFPAPIIFALILNEVHQKTFKKTVQTASYMPYFISAVVVCGLVQTFCGTGGPISSLVGSLSGKSNLNMLNEPQYFWAIYVLMNLWQGLGYGSIIYLSALSSIDNELYEAAYVDGAGRWKQTIHITLPGLMPMIVMMLIMRMGSVFSVGADKILLLYNAATYETADVINTYVYRMGMLQQDYGLSTAVGLFNSLIGTAMLVGTNQISKKLSGTSMF